MTASPRLSLQQCVTLACLLDVTTPKPGNVHRGADFEDMTFLDFVVSAIAIGPVVANVDPRSTGRTILEAIRATRRVTSVNTNLGIVLLLVPLAAAAKSRGEISQANLKHVLANLHIRDSECVYEAIRLAQPGGLGTVEQHDIQASPPDSLLDAMALSADRDWIARAFVTDFAFTIGTLVPRLVERVGELKLTDGILDTFVWLLATEGDTLIRRKCGRETAEKASAMAQRVLEAGPPGSDPYRNSLAELDFWLRSDGHRRNPGTCADLLTAAIFVGLWQQQFPSVSASQVR